MSYNIPGVSTDQTVGKALEVASDGCNEINSVLKDIQANNILGDDGTTNNGITDTGAEVLAKYNVTGTANITQASGAMVIDDLMQKISTKVQVAAQLLSTANNINKTVSRIMSQG